MTTNVLVIDTKAAEYAKRLRAEFSGIRVFEARTLAELADDPAEVDVLISLGLGVDDALFHKAVRLKWAQCLAAGVDRFLKCRSFRRDVILTSMRGIHGPAMRESAALLMLSLARDLPRHVRNQAAHRWDRGQQWPMLCGKTAVIVGIGVAGTAIGQLLHAFGMRVIGLSRTPRAIEGFDAMAPLDRLVEVAAEADYLIDVLPGTDENRARIGRAVFAAMKAGAFFVNIGRGDTVDEAALYECLAAKRIAGAALDVFPITPLPADSLLWDLPNVLITPHISGFFAGYENYTMPLIIDNMRAFLGGRTDAMKNVVAH